MNLHVKVKIMFQRVQEVYDFLLGVAGSEIPSLMASFSNFVNFFLNSYIILKYVLMVE